ncbi:MAG: hypothetical protein HWQ38_14670 [Nostoc sp. NMS7]|uniref:hypothetical protein n=1 Tax=unclassified Nostoc TaxID=2593658 RepID=UPI0025F318CD|nr:hypothetical protein [Nostoc sp. NMS7]MBN3947626.1 hypothetical protein [Nostoc sp. NMS7]
MYKYIENKKLKSGAIASYPRVIGHRHPDNPTHWRWGFNWEEIEQVCLHEDLRIKILWEN